MNRSIRAKHRKTYRTLAIIGNGFDLNHHYATGYNSFIEATNSKSLDLFKEYCAQNNNITTWYLFEDNINRLTQDLFFESIKNSYNNEAMKVKQSLLRDAFADIHNLLIQYFLRRFIVQIEDQCQKQHGSSLVPEGILGLAALGRGIFEQVGDKPLDVVICFQIDKWIVAMAFLHVDQIQHLNVISLFLQEITAIPKHFAFRVQNHIAAGGIHKAGLGKESSFTGTGTAATKDV